MLEMSMERNDQNSNETTVSLEALLRLKRHEKPSEAFWDQFDRELEKKRLQAMVTREPWYGRILHGLGGQIRPAMALGLVSVLALGGLLVVKEQILIQSDPTHPTAVENDSAVAMNPEDPEEITPVTAISSLASTTRQPARISISDADFGVDVIASQPESYRFRSYRTDMEPATYQVSRERSASYLPDSLSLTPSRSSLSSGSSF